MQRAAVQVDVPSVGLSVHPLDACSQSLEQGGRKMGRGSVRAIGDQVDAAQAGRHRRSEVVHILAVQSFVDRQGFRRRMHTLLGEREDVPLQFVFLLIGQFQPGMVDNLDTVIAIGIVRSGDHDARGKGTGLGDMSETGCRDQAGEARPYAVPLQSSGDMFRDPGSGFARVHSDDHFPSPAMLLNPARQRHTHRERRRAVERVLPRHPAHSIGPE